MATLHVSNIVRNYDSWKGNFDKFEEARKDRGVRGYRIARGDERPTRVIVDPTSTAPPGPRSSRSSSAAS